MFRIYLILLIILANSKFLYSSDSYYGYSRETLENIMEKEGYVSYEGAMYFLKRQQSNSDAQIAQRLQDEIDNQEIPNVTVPAELEDNTNEFSTRLMRVVQKYSCTEWEGICFLEQQKHEQGMLDSQMDKLLSQDFDGGVASTVSPKRTFSNSVQQALEHELLFESNFLEKHEVTLNMEDRTILNQLKKSIIEYDTQSVHQFNKQWSSINIGTLQIIYSKYFPQQHGKNFHIFYRELTIFCQTHLAHKTAALEKAFQLLLSYGVNGYRDVESGVKNTLDILLQNYAIANSLSDSEQSEAKSFMVDSLIENEATGGGCTAGFAGRFVRDQYCLLYRLPYFTS